MKFCWLKPFLLVSCRLKIWTTEASHERKAQTLETHKHTHCHMHSHTGPNTHTHTHTLAQTHALTHTHTDPNTQHWTPSPVSWRAVWIFFILLLWLQEKIQLCFFYDLQCGVTFCLFWNEVRLQSVRGIVGMYFCNQWPTKWFVYQRGNKWSECEVCVCFLFFFPSYASLKWTCPILKGPVWLLKSFMLRSKISLKCQRLFGLHDIY